MSEYDDERDAYIEGRWPCAECGSEPVWDRDSVCHLCREHAALQGRDACSSCHGSGIGGRSGYSRLPCGACRGLGVLRELAPAPAAPVDDGPIILDFIDDDLPF